MSGVSVRPGLLLSVFLLLNHCGGRATEVGSSGGAGGTVGTVGDPDDCAGAATDGGCGGEQGELAPYARLRTSCSHDTHVHRAGAPVSIDCNIR